jgi:hypothetical protein
MKRTLITILLSTPAVGVPSGGGTPTLTTQRLPRRRRHTEPLQPPTASRYRPTCPQPNWPLLMCPCRKPGNRRSSIESSSASGGPCCLGIVRIDPLRSPGCAVSASSWKRTGSMNTTPGQDGGAVVKSPPPEAETRWRQLPWRNPGNRPGEIESVSRPVEEPGACLESRGPGMRGAR